MVGASKVPERASDGVRPGRGGAKENGLGRRGKEKTSSTLGLWVQVCFVLVSPGGIIKDEAKKPEGMACARCVSKKKKKVHEVLLSKPAQQSTQFVVKGEAGCVRLGRYVWMSQRPGAG